MKKRLKESLKDCCQKKLIMHGPQPFFKLGKLSCAKKVLKKCCKALAASKKWQRTKKGDFCYNGETKLHFCAMWGPVISVNFNGKKMRLQTALVQRKRNGPVRGYAFDITSHDVEDLGKRLHLSNPERKALDAMLRAGKDLLAGQEYRLKVKTKKFLPTARAAGNYGDYLAAAKKLVEAQQLTLSTVWEKLGETGRELVLAGILNQLSAKAKDKERPPLFVNLVKCGRYLDTVRRILGAVNFSFLPGVNGTAPSVYTVSAKDQLPFSYGEMELYDAGRNGHVFLAKLEAHQRIHAYYSSIPCPFQAVPLLLTDNISANGGVWNIEFEEPLAILSGEELDCLRAAASSILQNPKNAFRSLYWEVFVRSQNPDAYRTTLAERWRTALASRPLQWWFAGAGEQESAKTLLASDEAKRKEREEQHVRQVSKALEVLFDPATYKDGGVQAKPKTIEDAEEILKRSFALYYAPLILSIVVDTFNSKKVMRYAAESKAA